MDTQKLDLRKQMVLNLTKDLGIQDVKAEVVFVIDRSGSMGGLYANGTVLDTLERLVPISMQFDDNGEADFFLFNDGFYQGQGITKDNVAQVLEHAANRYGPGGTQYAPIINAITQKYGNRGNRIEKAGLFGKMFGQKDKVIEGSNGPRDLPVYVIFITDGENSDKGAAQQAIATASNQGIFWQFVGIGYEQFNFLQKLDTMSGRFIDNANFFKVPDLARTEDKELYKLLLTEFPSYIKEAKAKGLIKA